MPINHNSSLAPCHQGVQKQIYARTFQKCTFTWNHTIARRPLRVYEGSRSSEFGHVVSFVLSKSRQNDLLVCKVWHHFSSHIEVVQTCCKTSSLMFVNMNNSCLFSSTSGILVKSSTCVNVSTKLSASSSTFTSGRVNISRLRSHVKNCFQK